MTERLPYPEADVSCDFCDARRGERCRDTRTGSFTLTGHPSRRRKHLDEVGDHDWDNWVDHYHAFHE